MTRDEIMSRAQTMQRESLQPKYDPRDLPTGELLKGGFSRGIEGLKGTALDLIPALGGAIFGQQDYAREQLKEYSDRMAEAEAISPVAYKSYKDVQGLGDILPFAAETVGELGPNIASLLTGAGVGAVGGKYLAKKGLEKTLAANAAEYAAKRGVTGEAAKEVGDRLSARALDAGIQKKAIAEGARIGSQTGLIGSSMATNVPDVFQSIYEKTGSIEPGLSLVVGSVVGLLDTYLPSKIISQLGPAGKNALAAQLLEKSTVVPTTWKKAFGAQLLKTAAGEGGTEGLQEVLTIAGEQMAGDKQEYFSPENIDRIITSAVKGVVGGTTYGAPGAALQARAERDLRNQQIAENEAKALQDQQIAADAQRAAAQEGPPAPIPQQQGDIFEQAGQATPYDARQAQEAMAAQTAPVPPEPPAQQQQGLDLQGGMTAEQMQVAQQDQQNQEMNQLYMEEAAVQQQEKIARVQTAKQILDDEISLTDERVRQGDINRREAARLDLLHPVLDNPTIQDTITAFQENLKRAGYASLKLTDTEKALIKKADNVKAALLAAEQQPQANEVVNELSPEITGIKEKAEKGPAGTPKPREPQQLALQGVGQPRIAEAPVEAAVPEVEYSTVLDAPLLDSTGLSKQSGFYRQLLNKDMANPQDQVAIGRTIAGIRSNPNLAPATKQAIESMAMQAFNALATQQEMFGPRGAVLKGAESGRVRARSVSETGGKGVSVSKKQGDAKPAKGPSAPKPGRVDDTKGPAGGPGVRKENKRSALKEEKVEPKATKPKVKPTTTKPAVQTPIAEVIAEEDINPDPEAVKVIRERLTELNDRLHRETDPDEKAYLRDEISNLRIELSDSKFRIRAGKVGGLPMAEVKKLVGRIVANWTRAPEIRVVQSVSDLGPVIEKAMRDAKAEYAPAFYDAKTKTVILIADNAIDLADVVKSIAHEATGHYGLQSILGSSYSKIMGEIYAGNRVIRELADAKLKDNPDLGKDLATEEVLADMQETGGPEVKELKGMAKLYNMIRNFLKRLGLPYVSDNDVAQLLADARNYVISGTGAKPGSNALLQSRGLVYRNPTFRNNPAAPGVNGSDARSIFDSFVDTIEDAGVLSPARADALHEFLKNGIVGNARKAALSVLPVKALTEEAKRAGLNMAPQFNTINDEHSGYVDRLNKSIEPLIRKAEEWAKNALQSQIVLFNKAKKEETSQADYDQVVRDYNKLTPKAKQLYENMRDAYGAMYQEILDSIEDRINTFVADPEAKAKIKADILEKLSKRGQIDPYFALTRKGKYWLSYNLSTTRDGETTLEPYVEAYETERERRRQIELLREEGAEQIQEFSQLSDYKYRSAPSGSFVNKVLNVLEVNRPKEPNNPTPIEKVKYEKELKAYNDNAEEVMNLYLSTLPETSFAQSFQKRKETLGFRRDAIEALRDRMYNTSQQLGRMRYSAKLNKLLDDMREYAKAASRGLSDKDEQGNFLPAKDNKLLNDYIMMFEKHANFIINPKVSKISSMLNTIGFNYLLGFNISSAAVNLAQVPMVVAPYLAGEHGWGETMSAINNAYSVYLNSGYGKDARTVEMIGSGEKVKMKAMPAIDNYGADTAAGKKYATAIKVWADNGQLNRSQFYDVLEVDGRKNWASTLNATSGFAFHHGERMNRHVSLVAGFDLQMKKLADKIKKGELTQEQAEKQAANYAMHVTELTNGGVSAAGAPLIAKNNIGKVLFMFKRYGVSMYYMLFKVTRDALKGETPEVRRAAMRQIAGVYGTAALFSGLQGIPMFGVAAMVYNLFADDDEDDMETATRKYVGEFAYKGMLNYVTGAEVASRFSLSDLIFRSNPSASSHTFEQGLLETLGGPVYGVGSRIKRGLDMMNEGNMQRGVENVLPSSISNVMKSYRYGTEGAKNLRGDPIAEDLNAFSIGAQALGFAPADYVRQLEINAQVKGVEKSILQKKSKLLQQYNISKRMGDFEEATEHKQELLELNKKYPALDISQDTFTRSEAAFKAATKRTVKGVQFSEKLYKEMMQNASEYDK
jgi:hypothetical protein